MGESSQMVEEIDFRDEYMQLKHTSEMGNSTVCSAPGLIAASVAGSAVVNTRSPSRLSPPYCTGTCSGAMYLEYDRQTTRELVKNGQ